MTIRKNCLIAAGAALILALPVTAQAQADQAPADQTPADQAPPVPPTDPTMAAPAASAPAASVAQPPAADTGAAAKEYPPCSKTVTDGCTQSGGGSHGKARKSSRHKKG